MPPKISTLKQKLAGLSLGPSSPTSFGSSTPPGSPADSRRRPFNFNPPWNKRHQSFTPNEGGYGDMEVVQEVMSRMIFQAGVDFETRPMVVLNASALPDPDSVSYDVLLSRVLACLNLYVESDYTVVFFAAGGKYSPGWNWVWKAYRSLSRKYRKNLKRLYIVHSSFFSKMLFSLAGAIISPKFFQKLVYINTLSELAEHVPLTQIDIPPAVYKENAKYESKIVLPVPARSSIFGVPLEELMGFNGEKGGIPRVVKDCIQFLRERGLEEEGLFRRSPSSAMLRAAQEAYDRGNVLSLHTFGDPHLAAVLLKKYLRDLPEPIFPEKLYSSIHRCPVPTNDPTDMSSITYIRESLLPELVPCAYILLSNILHLLHEIALRSASNRMDAHNLAVVVCPNLLKSSNPARDVMMCSIPGGPLLFRDTSSSSTSSSPSIRGRVTLGMVIKLCIQRYYEIFDEIWDRSEALPQRGVGVQDVYSPSSSSLEDGTPTYVLQNDDDDDLDDEMLVMPIGPTRNNNNTITQAKYGSPQSSWTAARTATGAEFGTITATGAESGKITTKRHKSTLSGGSGSGVRSVHTVFGINENWNRSSHAYPTMGKARSVFSIENGAGPRGGRKGSISVGRGTTRKSSAAGVEALGITANGFFAAPTAHDVTKG